MYWCRRDLLRWFDCDNNYTNTPRNIFQLVPTWQTVESSSMVRFYHTPRMGRWRNYWRYAKYTATFTMETVRLCSQEVAGHEHKRSEKCSCSLRRLVFSTRPGLEWEGLCYVQQVRLARPRTICSYARAKDRYDARHLPVTFAKCELAWLWMPLRKKGLCQKLFSKYFGPLDVTQRLSDVTYIIAKATTQKQRSEICAYCTVETLQERLTLTCSVSFVWPRGKTQRGFQRVRKKEEEKELARGVSDWRLPMITYVS